MLAKPAPHPLLIPFTTRIRLLPHRGHAASLVVSRSEALQSRTARRDRSSVGALPFSSSRLRGVWQSAQVTSRWKWSCTGGG